MTRPTCGLIAIAAAAVVTAGGLATRVTGQPAQSAPTTAASALDAIVEAPIKASQIAGASIAVTRRGDTFGVKDTLVIFERESGRVARLTLDSVFGHYPLKRKSPGTN
jgi:CubicO group peptidase (beta-lactamase class C family)